MNGSEPFRHHPTARRVIGTSTRLDSSFRALCEVMFLDAGLTKDLKINLFGAPVARVSYSACLLNSEQVTIKDGKASVSCVIGRHTFPGDEDMYGAMLYCENTLITAYARPHNLEFKNGRGNKDDEEHFSTVAVINLRKEDGFKPTSEKLEFHFNDQDKEAFWNVLKGKIEDYADTQGTKRNDAFPLRPLVLRLLKDLKTQLRDYPGVKSGDEGPLRGVLRTPPTRERRGGCGNVPHLHQGAHHPARHRAQGQNAGYQSAEVRWNQGPADCCLQEGSQPRLPELDQVGVRRAVHPRLRRQPRHQRLHRSGHHREQHQAV